MAIARRLQWYLDAKGVLTSWHFINVNSGGSAVETPYRVGKRQSRSISSNAPLRHGSYRTLAATANSFAELVFWRSVVGFGLGGEWSAGAVLVSETWPPERRGPLPHIELDTEGWLHQRLQPKVVSIRHKFPQTLDQGLQTRVQRLSARRYNPP